MIRELARQLPGDTAGFDAQILLAHITGHNRAWLLGHPEATLTDEQANKLATSIHKLQNGVPLPYILGHWEFFGLDFLITPAVLIPRPETELLVETALGYVRSHPQSEYRILDIGTGSGIIPISLAIHIPKARLTATDISASALEIARLNAERHNISERIGFIETDLLPDNLQSRIFDIICANLPYIPSETLKDLDIYGKEPTLALDGGVDGMDLIRRLMLRLARDNPMDTLILLEFEERQGPALSSQARETFPKANIRIQRDLAGYDRVLVINT